MRFRHFLIALVLVSSRDTARLRPDARLGQRSRDRPRRQRPAGSDGHDLGRADAARAHVLRRCPTGASSSSGLIPGEYRLRAELPGLGTYETPVHRGVCRRTPRCGHSSRHGDGGRRSHGGGPARRHQGDRHLGGDDEGTDREAAARAHVHRHVPARAGRRGNGVDISDPPTSGQRGRRPPGQHVPLRRRQRHQPLLRRRSTRTSPSSTSRRSTSRAAASPRSSGAPAASSSTASPSPAPTTSMARRGSNISRPICRPTARTRRSPDTSRGSGPESRSAAGSSRTTSSSTPPRTSSARRTRSASTTPDRSRTPTSTRTSSSGS